MKRTFFAIDIQFDAILSGVLADIRNQLKEDKIKWTPSDQLHLTLKFLGDTPENSIQNIINIVSQPLGKMPASTLQLFSIGLFKNLRNPRIIWVGIKPCPFLQQAMQLLNYSLIPFGYTADKTEFLPHLTIGRIKEIKQTEKLGKLIERYQDESFGTVSVKEIVFYESILKPEGPQYIPLTHFPLQ